MSAAVQTVQAAPFSIAEAEKYGRAFIAAGYHPVPVLTGSKKAVDKGWPGKALANQFRPREGVTNIGLLTHDLQAVDIDCDDPAIAEEIRSLALIMFGPAPERYRRGSPRCLLLYRPSGSPQKKRRVGSKPNQVEVLGDGQFFVAAGTHESGAGLAWRDLVVDRTRFVRRDDLTAISPEQVENFLQRCSVILGPDPAKPPKVSGGGATSSLSASPEELKARDPDALAEIVRQIPNDERFDDRESWVGMAHALAAAFAERPEIARDLWLAHATKRPQKDGEAEKVWSTLNTEHEIGEEWLLKKAEAAGIDVSRYKAGEFQTQAPALPAVDAAAGVSVAWPYGYTMTDGGLMYQPPESKDEDRRPLRICDRFDVLAETRDASSTNWGLALAWKDRDGCKHNWTMPKSLIHADGSAIAAELEDAGLRCRPGRVAQGQLKDALGGVMVSARLTCVQKAGWHDNATGHAFVLPSGDVFGSAGGTIVLQTNSAKAAGAFGQAGTLAEWHDAIGRYGVGNSRLALFLSAAFAGPLLDIASEPSGGFHLVGKSQSGKSSCAFAAGSVWGCGDRGGQVRSWRATANGLEGVAAECSDTVLILDELGQADGRDVGDIVYGVANEAGKARATRTGEARARKTWRVIMLSTGEVSLAAKMITAGHRAQAGQEVRLATLPADAGAGLGAFESLHDVLRAGALADRLRAAAKATYGTAGRAFLARLTEARAADEAGLRAHIAAAREAFIAHHAPAGADGQVRSVAGRFGVIASAGELAADWGVLPWPAGEATRAAGVCFAAWLGERGGAGAGEDAAAITQVRAFLETHGDSRFTLIEPNPNVGRDRLASEKGRTVNRVGFRRRVTKEIAVVKDGKPANEKVECFEYLILPEAWQNEVCKGVNPKRAAQVLKDAGFLDCEDNRTSIRHSIPEHGQVRVYAVSGTILVDADSAVAVAA